MDLASTDSHARALTGVLRDALADLATRLDEISPVIVVGGGRDGR